MGDIFADMKIELPQVPDLAMILTRLTHNLGGLMVIDDLKDYGRFSFPGHPSPIHHWWVGELMQQISEMIGAGLVMWKANDAIDREEKAEILEAFNFHAYSDLFKLKGRG